MSVQNHLINLLNFELPQCRHSRYVLTSPKSLKACRKANVKPVDLLYKSLSDVEKELGRKTGALEVFQSYEKERQRKLEICRRLRNEILMHGSTITRPSSSLVRTPSPRINSLKCLPKITDTPKKSNTPESFTGFDQQLIAKSPESLETPKPKYPPLQTFRAESFSSKRETPLSSVEEKDSISSAKTLPLVEPAAKSITYDKPQFSTNESTETKYNSVLERLDVSKSAGSKNKNKIEKKGSPSTDYNFENINNNHKNELKQSNSLNALQRPTSSSRKKTRDKKMNKAWEFRWLMDRIKEEYTDPEYRMIKYKQIVENSIERELKELDVRKAQRAIEENVEIWQDRILTLQWLDLERAKEQADNQLRVKIQRLQNEMKSREILHMMNLNKVKKEDDVRVEVLRRVVQNKERKILELQQDRERAITESKSRALTVAELKEQLRNIITPETFDRKAAKCGFEKKLLFQSPAMCPRVMQNSHISLG